MPPETLQPTQLGLDVSSSLSSVVALGKSGPNSTAAFTEGTEGEFLLHSTASLDTEAAWEVGGMVLRTLPPEARIEPIYRGASADLCHLLFEAKETEVLLPKTVEAKVPQIYELARGCNGEPVSLRLVGLDNKGDLIDPFDCQITLGSDTYSELPTQGFNAIADGGKELFFTTCPDGVSSHHQLFVRLDGSRTLEVSKPLAETQSCSEVPCSGAPQRANADFVGASEDGSRVFFTSTQEEVPGVSDGSTNLYMAMIGCRESEPECETANREVTSLVQVSHDPSGAAAEVQGVVKVAPDGKRIYFVAGGDLLSEAEQQILEGEGRAVPHVGAANLYAYDSTSPGSVAFIGDLCSGLGRSGTAVDVHCYSKTGDVGLWSSHIGTADEAQTAGADGGFLVFSTYAQLTGNDTDAARDVYRYDAETGVLDRISIGEAGYDANGNSSLFDATIAVSSNSGDEVRIQHEMGTRAVGEDGSRIVFTSSEPLSPAATNGLANVYEWHEGPGRDEGSVSLVSSGSAEDPVEDVVISPEGNDIFFVTTQGLVSQDTDGAPDIYDARLGGGFPQSAAPVQPCSGDACQGPLTNPAPLLVPGSVSQASGENFAAQPVVKVKPKSKPVTCKKGYVKKKGKCVKRPKARRASSNRRARS